MENNDSQNSFRRRTKYTNYKTSMRKPYYNMNTTYNTSRYSSNKPNFCFRCETLRPCKCGSLEPYSFFSTSVPPPIKYSSPSRYSRQSSPGHYMQSSPARHNNNMGKMLPSDSYTKDDDTPKCLNCNCSLVAPRCPCGQPTYCCECEYVNPCACGQYEKICCLKCNSFLVPPKCTCGKPTFCLQCEEVTPCEECHNTEDNTGLPKCFNCKCNLVPPKCTCGKPMYCVQCEEITPCNCSKSKNLPKCQECSYVLTPPRCGCGQPTYCWHCEEISSCKNCNSGKPNSACDKKVSIQPQATYIPSQPSSQAKERECKCQIKSKRSNSKKKCKYYQIMCSSLKNLTKPKGNTKLIVKRIKSPGRKSKKLCCI